VGRSPGPLRRLTKAVRPICEHAFVLSTNQKGGIAETAILAAATKLGVSVLRPAVEHGRYDLAFEIGENILRVQCKWGGLHDEGAVIKVNLTSSWCTPTGYEYRSYTENEIDLVAVYCGELDRCYLLPRALAVNRRAIHLRVKPPKNGQRACLNLAVDFEFPGAVAQLEEHLDGIEGARGSSPLSSTSPPATHHVGAHEFRNHFGYYLERAAAGDEVRVSRRGRPYVRLIPEEPRLRLVS
jgi:prevent-host-death family protein